MSGRAWLVTSAVLLAVLLPCGNGGCRSRPGSPAGRGRRNQSDVNRRCRQLNADGNHYSMTGQYDSAIACYRRALRLAIDSSLDNRAAASCQNLGIAFEALGQHDSADHFYAMARSHTDTSSMADKNMSASVLMNHAAFLIVKSREQTDSTRCFAKLDTARSELEQALALTRKTAARFDEASIAYNLGVVLATLGRDDSAYALFSAALVAYGRDPAVDGQAQTLSALGKILFSHGAFDSAAKVMKRAVALAPHVTEKVTAGHIIADLGTIFGEIGNYPAARECFEQALEIYQRTNQPGAAEEMNANLLLLDILQSLQPDKPRSPEQHFKWHDKS